MRPAQREMRVYGWRAIAMAKHDYGDSPERAHTLDAEEFRRIAYHAVDLAAEHLFGIRERPVFKPMTPDERAELLQEPMPADGMATDAILEHLRTRVMPHPMGNGHPRFFGWVNSPPAMLAVATEIIAAAINPSCAGGDHAAIYLERCAVRWLVELVGFPTEGSMGILVSGASMATLTAFAAARHRAAVRHGWNVRDDGLQSGHPPLIIYMSSEGHGCFRKAAELLGLGTAAIRTIPVDDAFHMEVPALESAIAEDRAGGREPFCVAVSAGTVNTGAIDPLDKVADLCAKEDLWMHVDGAYGAVGVLDPEVAPRFNGLARADSVALDPHKWLSVPVECGCVFVRDGAMLRQAFSLVPPYVRTEEGKGFGGLPWYSEYGFQQTRGFRALKLWVTLAHAGRDRIASIVSRHIRLARRLASILADAPDFEVLAPVELSIVCFRYVPAAIRDDDKKLNDLNQRLIENVQAGGEAFVSGTTLNTRTALRACVLHYATTEDDIKALVEIVRHAGSTLAASTAG
jgi:aromatic-L-amino-acid/L-tryptophan decarboxylase